MGIINFTYLDLPFISPKSGKLIQTSAARRIREKIEAGKFTSGSAASLKMQVEKIEERAGMNCELVFIPGFMSTPSKQRVVLILRTVLIQATR